MPTNPEVEILIEEIRSKADRLIQIGKHNALSISFETICRIEKLGRDLYFIGSDMKNQRISELEKLAEDKGYVK